MGVLEFIKERNRMCHYYNDDPLYLPYKCMECPLHEYEAGCNTVDGITEDYIAVVEQWSQEHPRKTRQSNLLEMFPTARLDCHGVLMVCPANIDVSNCADDGACANPTIGCDECRREFWMQGVE